MGSGSRRRPVPKLLAKKLKLIRTRLEVGQLEMGRLLSNKHSAPDSAMVSRFERGEREPNLFVILQYAKLARVNVALLIDDDWSLKELDAEIPPNVSRAK
jgi:transcriptional regulator with XRE-family HTH domain